MTVDNRRPSGRDCPLSEAGLGRPPGRVLATTTTRFERDKSRSSGGQALVEFALILTTLILICVAVLDLSRIFFSYEALANAVRDGARYCALNPGDTPNTIARIVAELDGTVVPDTSATVCPVVGAGNPFTVSAGAAFAPITPLVLVISGGPLNLNVSATMIAWT